MEIVAFYRVTIAHANCSFLYSCAANHFATVNLAVEHPRRDGFRHEYVAKLRRFPLKVLKCDDLNPGCKFKVRGNSESEVLKKAAEQAKTAHAMHNIPQDVLLKARGAIRDERGTGV